jgi:hypothetical protein
MHRAQSLSPARLIQAVAADDIFEQQRKEGHICLLDCRCRRSRLHRISVSSSSLMHRAQSLSPARLIQAVAADDIFEQQRKEGHAYLIVVVVVAASIASAYRRRR